MAGRKRYLPRNDADFNTFFKNLAQYTGQKTSGTNPEWAHIPPEEIGALNTGYENWYTVYAPCLKPHTPVETREKNRIKKESEKLIRGFINRNIRYASPVKDADRDHLGVPNPNIQRSSQNVPAERVEFAFRIKGIRELQIDFRVQGSANKAKPAGYDGAAVVWDISEKAPEQPEALTRHAVAKRTPFTIKFDEGERGKTVYAALCWQNGKAQTGTWSEMQSTIVP